MNPAGDFAGGGMAEVIRNTALLYAYDRAAIAAYIASLPPRQGPETREVSPRSFRDLFLIARSVGTFSALKSSYDAPKALKVMMVRVSWMPGMVCTFWAMKWPISVPGSI